MWWLVTLLVLAFIAYFIVKSLKSSTEKQQKELDQQRKHQIDVATGSANNAAGAASDVAAAGAAASGAAVAGVAASSAAVAGAAASSAAAAGTAAKTAVTDAAVAGAEFANSGNSSVSAAGNLMPTGNLATDVREMIKILNLDGADANRLQISRDELTALRKGDAAGMPAETSLVEVAAKLRKMLA